jgi:hypothetical protein
MYLDRSTYLLLAPWAPGDDSGLSAGGETSQKATITCRDMPELILQYFTRDKALKGERHSAVENHLNDCESCRRKLLALRIAFA